MPGVCSGLCRGLSLAEGAVSKSDSRRRQARRGCSYLTGAPWPHYALGAASSAWLAPSASASGLLEAARPPAAGSGQGGGRQIGRRTWHPTWGHRPRLRAPATVVLLVAASWASGRPRSGCHHTAVAVPGLKADHVGGRLSGGATSQPVPSQTPHSGFTFSGPAVWTRPVLSQKMHRMRGAS